MRGGLVSWGGCLTGASIAVLPQSLEPRVDLQGRAASLLDRLLPVLLAKIWWALWSCLLPRLRLGSSIVLLFNPCGRVYVYDHPLFGFWMNHRPLRSTSCQPFFDHGRPRVLKSPLSLSQLVFVPFIAIFQQDRMAVFGVLSRWVLWRWLRRSWAGWLCECWRPGFR